MTEEWFMFLLLYCLPLLFKFWQRSGSCCCYIVYHYSFRFDRGVVHVVVVMLSTITFKVWQRSGSCCFGWLYYLPLPFNVWQMKGWFCCCYIFYHYCLRLDRGVAHLIVILSTISVKDFTEEWFMLLLLLYCRILLF